MTINTIGVIGAGQMGNGIAHIFALAGHEVLLNDVDADALSTAKDKIQTALERQIARDIISETDAKSALGLISTTENLPDLGKTNLVIEAG